MTAQIRVVAISSAVAGLVRATMKAPVYGHPAHIEHAVERAPCRHCLRLIRPGAERQILFTYDRFAGVEALPLPGPVYIHEHACERYPENGGFPDELRASPRTLEGYALGRRLLTQEYITNGEMEKAIEKILMRTDVDYIQVSSTTAGCYTFRIERTR